MKPATEIMTVRCNRSGPFSRPPAFDAKVCLARGLCNVERIRVRGRLE